MFDPVEIPIQPDPAELEERARLPWRPTSRCGVPPGEALASIRLPLGSARWSKSQLESNIRNTGWGGDVAGKY